MPERARELREKEAEPETAPVTPQGCRDTPTTPTQADTVRAHPLNPDALTIATAAAAPGAGRFYLHPNRKWAHCSACVLCCLLSKSLVSASH